MGQPKERVQVQGDLLDVVRELAERNDVRSNENQLTETSVAVTEIARDEERKRPDDQPPAAINAPEQRASKTSGNRPKAKSPDYTRVTLFLPNELMVQLYAAALPRGRKVTTLIEEIVTKAVAKKATK